MDKNLISKLQKTSEDYAHQEDGVEFWLARDLQVLLDYDEWRNFLNVIDKARFSCENSGHKKEDHFVDANKTIDMPKGATKEIVDYKLTRYACYLIAQNGDPRQMKMKLNIPQNRPMADFLPTVTITAKNLAAEITNFNVKKENLGGENVITSEHVKNNKKVRGVLVESGIVPEELPSEENIKKLGRRVSKDEKKIVVNSKHTKRLN